MELFKYTGNDERTYPGRGLVVQPGDEVEWDAAPDASWASLDNPAPVEEAPVVDVQSVKTPEASPAPSETPEATPAPSDPPSVSETPSDATVTTPPADAATV